MIQTRDMATIRYKTTDMDRRRYRSRDMATEHRELSVAEMIAEDERDWRVLDSKAV
jgi:hypothetical protein